MTVDGIVEVFDHHRKEVEKYRKRGELYGSACVTELDMMLDEVLVRLENNEPLEEFLVDMEEKGYEVLGTFEEETLL